MTTNRSSDLLLTSAAPAIWGSTYVVTTLMLPPGIPLTVAMLRALPAGLLLLKSAEIQGIGVGHRRALEDLVRAVDAVNLQPVIDQVYHFDQLPQALDHLHRGPFGKIVLTP